MDAVKQKEAEQTVVKTVEGVVNASIIIIVVFAIVWLINRFILVKNTHSMDIYQSTRTWVLLVLFALYIWIILKNRD